MGIKHDNVRRHRWKTGFTVIGQPDNKDPFKNFSIPISSNIFDPCRNLRLLSNIFYAYLHILII